MSGLRDRLVRLTGHHAESAAGSDGTADADTNTGPLETEIEESTASAGGSAARAMHPEFDGWHRIGCELCENGEDSYIVRRTVHPFQWPQEQLLQELGSLSQLMKDAPAVLPSVENVLYFDTETTGLGVGSGNVPFMIGVGFFRDNGFWVEQYFIRNPAEECAMLEHVKMLLESYDYLVTYNGKSFDWPVLKNRYIINRIEMDEPSIQHLDFLHPSRNLWKKSMSSVSLGNVEAQQLGIVREDDVPGSMAPALYFQYLAEKKPYIMRGVFEHNEQDIVSLAYLAVHLGSILCGNREFTKLNTADLFQLGRWLAHYGLMEQAFEVFGYVLERPTAEIHHMRPLLAAYYKKQKDWQTASSLWQAYTEDTAVTVSALNSAAVLHSASLEPYIELAKYYEHREKDFGRALQYAEQARLLLHKKSAVLRQQQSQRRDLRSGREKEQKQLEKRIARLMSKRQKKQDQSEAVVSKVNGE